MEYNDIPSADGNLDEVNRPNRTSLKMLMMIISYSFSKPVIITFMLMMGFRSSLLSSSYSR